MRQSWRVMSCPGRGASARSRSRSETSTTPSGCRKAASARSSGGAMERAGAAIGEIVAVSTGGSGCRNLPLALTHDFLDLPVRWSLPSMQNREPLRRIPERGRRRANSDAGIQRFERVDESPWVRDQIVELDSRSRYLVQGASRSNQTFDNVGDKHFQARLPGTSQAAEQGRSTVALISREQVQRRGSWIVPSLVQHCVGDVGYRPVYSEDFQGLQPRPACHY